MEIIVLDIREVKKNNFDKNEKIWNSIINTDSAEHEEIQAYYERKSQKKQLKEN